MRFWCKWAGSNRFPSLIVVYRPSSHPVIVKHGAVQGCTVMPFWFLPNPSVLSLFTINIPLPTSPHPDFLAYLYPIAIVWVLQSRCWDGIWGARYLLGISTYEEKWGSRIGQMQKFSSMQTCRTSTQALRSSGSNIAHQSVLCQWNGWTFTLISLS